MAGERTQRLEIVTPERVVFSGDVRFVVAPGVDGELGVLPGHAPLVTGLKIGVVRVQKEGKETRFAVSGGFMEVRDNRVIILAEAAEREDEIDVERAKAAKKRAEERLQARSPDIDIARAELALKRALNRLKVAGG